MRVYLGYLALLIILWSFGRLSKKILGFSQYISWVGSCAFIILTLYVSAYFNILYQMSIILIIIGLSYGLFEIRHIIRTRKKWKININLLGAWVIIFVAIFATTLGSIHLDHYDNYSHWAVIVKFLYTENRLPEVTDTIISYTSYPMGSALFLYFVSILSGFSAQVLMMGQFVLILSCLYALFAVVRDTRRALVLAMMFTIMALFNHFNIAIRMNNLLVDYLLPLMALAGLAGIFAMRNQLKGMSIYTILIVGMLSLVKSSGLFFALIVSVFYLYCIVLNIIKSKAKLKVIIVGITITVLSYLPITAWNFYVKINFPVTKHEVSIDSYQDIFSSKGTEVIQKITDLFVNTIFSIDTLSTQGIILVQLIMVAAFIAIRFVCKRKNPLLWQLMLINIIVVIYYVGIYYMFLFSMPTDEALYLAGFDCYASSIVILALGLAMMFLARQMDYTLFEQRIDYRTYASYKSINTKKLYQFSTILLLFSSTLLLFSESNGMLYNEKLLKDSTILQFELLTDQHMDLTEESYLVVSTNQSEVENYFVGFYGSYWLYSPNVDGRENFVMSEDEFVHEIGRYDKVVILEEHYTFNEMTNLVSGKRLEPGIYDSDIILTKSGQ